MIITRDFSATKESPKRSFHVDISKIPIQKREYGYSGLNLCICRSSRPEVFCEKVILRKFCKIHRKTSLSKSLF